MRSPLIVGNWKMFPVSLAAAAKLFERHLHHLGQLAVKVYPEIVICPPALYLAPLQSILDNSPLRSFVQLGAQNGFWAPEGRYTGEISPLMLKNIGCSTIILGHSERRRFLAETDRMINKKLAAALENGLRVVLAIGEEQREPEASDIIRQQLERALAGIKHDRVAPLISIAYEPVWAISQGLASANPATPDQALQAVLLIRKTLTRLYSAGVARETRVLYGGSTNAGNVGDFMAIEDIDGVLPGAASLEPVIFAKMAKIVGQSRRPRNNRRPRTK